MVCDLNGSEPRGRGLLRQGRAVFAPPVESRCVVIGGTCRARAFSLSRRARATIAHALEPLLMATGSPSLRWASSRFLVSRPQNTLA